ncbi:MAG: amidohydrolase [Cereibacter sphaeroides]|uniref:Amidohydrolase n=1 Tax=Cereibacter sphaeroides TaxID=1063 RepID=A0A2W5S9W7_CERSP|nr:MAG: amidohydrolase [Cereibacter sphaeroides]
MIDFERLIDHHCHGIVPSILDRPRLEAVLSESHRPVIPGVTQFDKPVGLILRRFCAPVLDLPEFADPADYVARRAELGEEAARRLMRAAGISQLLIDTGHRSTDILGVSEMAELTGCPAREVVRIEAVMEEAARSASGGADLLDRFDTLLMARVKDAVALKSIVAYRCTFAIDQTKPTRTEAAKAGDAWLKRIGTGGWQRLEDSTLIRHALYLALDICAERKFPLQLHVGVGDRDVDMPKCDPTVFIPFILEAEARDVPITLLHCYPFIRESTWMAEVFSNVYFDVGFTLNFTGPQAIRIMEEALEMGPFFKQLYSSDAFGLAELHHLGAIQFRRMFGTVMDNWIASGDITAREADRIAAMIGHGNTERIYRI